MASDRAYLAYILEQLSGLPSVTWRAMMGEFLLYVRGKLVGGIYDNRLLVKPTKAALFYLPQAAHEAPYTGAKEMLFVEEVDDSAFLRALFSAIYDDLAEPKKTQNRAHP